MTANPFVHLHLHTCYSLLDGACHIGPIMDRAVEDGMPAVAITDHGVLYGAIDFYKAARARGLKPIIGCEAYVAPGSRFDRKAEESAHTSHARHLVLLAENNTGYYNLMRLISAAHLEGFYYKPRIDKELLARRHEGLIGLSACLKGEVAEHLTQDRLDAAVRAAGEYAEILGRRNFFIEVQNHRLPDQARANRLMRELSRRSGIPLVATNDVHYLRREHAAAHEVLLCLQTGTNMADEKRMRYGSDEFFMKTRAEMEAALPEFRDALDLTLEIADRCNVEIEMGRLHFPTFAIPDGSTPREFLCRIGWEGLRKRYGLEDPLRPRDARERELVERFNREVEVIEKTGFLNYFLVVWDFIRFARENRIPVGPGRGSGGGSLVAYALGITAIDPLQYELIFERFLNPERVSPPDFDIDFCQNRRGEVIEYVKQKYGRENVAQIITFGSLGAKTVIRDLGRVLGIPFAKCDQLAKMVPEDPKIKLKQALESNPELKRAYETDPDCRRILDYGFVLEGLYRNPGTHAAGVVIGEKPLVELIPLARDKNEEPITQYAMEPLGELGLLKMDFLGLKTLTVVQETIDLVRAATGREIDIENLPLDDKSTFELLNRGDTVGLFQIEGAGMRDLIRRVGVDRIQDLIAIIALFRPGPMNMLDDYIQRKTGKASIQYDHPLLEPILKETYGVMVYQEQVQKAANVLAGYSLGEADILRRAMGKKKADVMEQQRAKFIQGCVRTSGLSENLAGRIFDTMAKFAGYGFNKAHSAGYGIIAYQTAYLKANHPVEFMAALISSEMGNSDKLPIYIAEAEELELQILPPDVNASRVRFHPQGRAIRFGLAGIKNVGESAAEAIVRERERGGPYRGLIDFCSRVDGQLCNKKVIESLIRCGAFDALEPNRARLFKAVDFAMACAARRLRDQRSGQTDLFEGPAGAATPEELPPAEPWHESELLAGERELLGVYLSGHPLKQHAALLAAYQTHTLAGLSALPDRALTRVGGIVSAVAKKVTKKKELMVVLRLEDLEGSAEVLVFPEPYQKFAPQIRENAVLILTGEVSRREDPAKLIAHDLCPLTEAPARFAQRLSLHLPASHLQDAQLERLRDLLRQHPGPVPVRLCLQYASGEKVFLDLHRQFRVLPDAELLHRLKHDFGEDCCFVAVAPPTPRQENRFPRPGAAVRQPALR